MESRIKVYCECGKTGLVDRKHIGKTITCPKCGVARIKVEDPEATSKPNDIVGTFSVASKSSPPTLPTELARNPFWTGRNILIGDSSLAVFAVVLVAGIHRFSNSGDLPNSPIADVAVVHPDQRKDELLPERGEQVEPKVVVKAMDVPEEAPEVILPPTPAEIAKDEFERLHSSIKEIARDHNLVSAPIDEEKRLLQAELDDLIRSGSPTSKDVLEKGRQALALTSKMDVIWKKYEIRVATEVKEYIKRLDDQNIPEDISSQCEQDKINKTILANDSPPAVVKGLVERMEQGGDFVMKTRQGRFWVLYRVKLTL